MGLEKLYKTLNTLKALLATRGKRKTKQGGRFDHAKRALAMVSLDDFVIKCRRITVVRPCRLSYARFPSFFSPFFIIDTTSA